jgi:hypothetical protein
VSTPPQSLFAGSRVGARDERVGGFETISRVAGMKEAPEETTSTKRGSGFTTNVPRSCFSLSRPGSKCTTESLALHPRQARGTSHRVVLAGFPEMATTFVP